MDTVDSKIQRYLSADSGRVNVESNVSGTGAGNMGREDFEQLSGGVIRRKSKRVVGLFLDGIGLDRATRRLERKVDLSRLVAGLISGMRVEVARYYTLIPYEDDARQFSFLDAVERAGLEVVLKRLPPKGVKRQVSMDVHMATDMMSFAFGQLQRAAVENTETKLAVGDASSVAVTSTIATPVREDNVRRSLVAVCPSRELSYAIYQASLFGAETSIADFGLFGTSDGWKGVDHWVDLSTSETIWRI